MLSSWRGARGRRALLRGSKRGQIVVQENKRNCCNNDSNNYTQRHFNILQDIPGSNRQYGGSRDDLVNGIHLKSKLKRIPT